MPDSPSEKKSADKESSTYPQSIRIGEHASTEESGDDKPKRNVGGRIVLEGPNWRKEFKLDEELPKDFPLRLETLPGGDSASEADEPRFMIGIRCVYAGPALTSHLKLDEQTILVENVVKGLPAAAAGIQKHDIILSVDGTSVRGVQNLIAVLSNSDGKEVAITGLRGGSEFTVNVTPQKLTARRAAEAAGDSFPPDGDFWRDSEIRSLPFGRRWIMGPGVRLKKGEQIDIEKIINQARRHRAKDQDSLPDQQEKSRNECNSDRND